MDQKQDNPKNEQAKAVMFSDNWDTAGVVLKDGIEVHGVIKTYQEKPDPHDDEHSLIRLEYEYEVGIQLFKRELEFSINTVHIVYGYAGGLTNTPKFKYSLDDFRNSMQPGQKLKIKTLKKQPYWFLVESNEVMAEVMRHDAVWRQLHRFRSSKRQFPHNTSAQQRPFHPAGTARGASRRAPDRLRVCFVNASRWDASQRCDKNSLTNSQWPCSQCR
jgi:hypothetical protein